MSNDERSHLLHNRHMQEPHLVQIMLFDFLKFLSTKLPDGFGSKLDERAVEYPWTFAKLCHSPPSPMEWHLDIGPTLNHLFCIRHLQKVSSELRTTFLSLTPENNCFYHQGYSYCLGDARQLNFKDDFFDIATCLSTLEHVGMDNRKYQSQQENKPSSHLDVIREVHRVLRTGGTFLITVPYGKEAGDPHRQHFGFTKEKIDRCIAEFQPKSFELYHYRYMNNQWSVSNATQCEKSGYTSENLSTSNEYDDIPIRAESVACLSLTK